MTFSCSIAFCSLLLSIFLFLKLWSKEMAPKNAHSIGFWELIITAIVSTFAVVYYETSWSEGFLLPTFNIQLEKINQD